MSISAYLKGQWEWIAAQAGVIILINLILLTSAPLAKTLGEIFYLDLLLLVTAAAGFFFHFRRLNRTYKEIRRIIKAEQGADVPETGRILGPVSALGESGVPGVDLMKELLACQERHFSRKENDYRQRMNDLKDYLTQTVHDLKVNLAVCELAVKRLENDVPLANKLIFQIEQMKFRINQTLSVARANHYSEDIAAEQVNLEEAVKEAIRDNAEFLIQKGISIHNRLNPYLLIGDQKWIRYIIGQILNNSSKYTGRNGEIIISGREDERAYHLHLRDNGIGIPAEEIDRVFDKGFTGTNGRNNPKSTGMGLYYAKKMADALGIGLTVQSRQGEYTEFILSFYKLSDYLQRQRD